MNNFRYQCFLSITLCIGLLVNPLMSASREIFYITEEELEEVSKNSNDIYIYLGEDKVPYISLYHA